MNIWMMKSPTKDQIRDEENIKTDQPVVPSSPIRYRATSSNNILFLKLVKETNPY